MKRKERVMKLSCVTASYVADLLGYPGEVDWGLASDKIVRAPMLETLDSILERLAPARLDGLEIWYPHVWPAKITPALASAIRRRLAAQGMICSGCAGGVADPADDAYAAEEALQTAVLLRAPTVSAHLPAGVAGRLGPLCAAYGVRVGYENGHDKDSADMLRAMAGSNEWIGVALDTGNLAAQGGDPVRAVRELGDRIIHVHFKDVPAVGSHDCVGIGMGIVDVAGVIRELKACGYDGWLSIEIETADRDPTDEIIASAETLRRAWAA
jgi:L-ribulose-5-phosphate 3-epimerase